MTCPCRAAGGDIYGFGGAAGMDAWHRECPESAAGRGVHPHGCTGFALSFLSWVAGSHALPQSLHCWNINNKTCMHLAWSVLEQITRTYQIARSFLGTEIWSLQKAEEEPLKVKASQATQNAVRYVHLWVMVFHQLLICVTKYYGAILRHI